VVAERLLPGASSDELLRRLEVGGHSRPVVLYSHRRAPLEHQHAFVVAVLVKPVDVADLRVVLLAAAATIATS
jgi:hypothetical protein